MRRTTALALSLLTCLSLVVPLAGGAGAQVPDLLDPAIQREVLTGSLITPTGMAIAPDGRVVIIHREGRVTVWEQDGTVTDAVKLPVDAYDRSGGQYDESACPRGDECPAGFNLAEGGIHGIVLAPDFLESGELYLYYTVVESLGMDPWPAKMPGARPHCDGGLGCPFEDHDEGIFRLSRFTMDLEANTIDPATELPIFENPAEWAYCCHYGGDMHWRADGTLLLTTGDDTTSDESGGYSPHDTRGDKTYNSAALTSQNLADRRGKVLRIDVADIEAGGDGIPGEGEDPNPFAAVEGADPYVYALGFRSPYRAAYDAETDHLYVGNVGPDARYPDPTRGPAAHDELEVVPSGGGTNHGWPFCIAGNIAYNEIDWETGTPGAPFDCSGMEPAAIAYSYTPSPATSPHVQILPQVGNTIMGGTAYRRPDSGALRLPEAFDDQLIWMEHSRGQLWRTPINADGTLDTAVTSLLPVGMGLAGQFGSINNPIDAEVGPDGAVYLIEANGFWNSTAGRLSRLSCAGCTPDPADYGGTAVALPGAATDALDVAAVDGGAATALPWAVRALVLAGLLGLVVVRRRRLV